jgi:hypothetical protein
LYEAWLSRRECCPEYVFHRRFLQHLQWCRPDERWVLKAPSHLYTLDALLATYPDAAIVQTHRDPVAAIGSVASLTEVLYGAFSHRVDRAAIGREVLERWSDTLERADHVRATASGVESRFLDVRYHDLVADPFRAVRTLYDGLGMELTADTERRMRRFLDENPKDRYGKHRYSLTRFGLDAADVGKRFSEYRDRYEVPQEVS